MKLEPFALERYFAQHEFSAKYLLSSSDCDGWPLSEILAMADPEARRLWENLRLGYTESCGIPLLRQEIAGLYSRVSLDDILVAAPQEAIFIAMNCLLEKGDHVVCTYPGYQSLYQVAQDLGCSVDQWEPEEKSGWTFDLDALARKLKPKTKLLVVNFPHNPTGHLPSADDYRAIIGMARKRGIHVFSDEMYRFLELDPAQSLPSGCDLYEKAVSLFGMSKSFGLAGLRIGWLATKDKKLLRAMAEFKDYTTICSSSPSEILALIGLRCRDKILEVHRRRIARNLGALDAFFLRHHDSLSWVRPQAGTIAFPRLLRGRDSARFCEAVVRKTQVLLLPSTVYGYGRRHFRVGFGRENMPEALARLEEFLSGYRWD